MRQAIAAARRRIGHRGASLLVLGIFDQIYALSILGAGSTGTAAARWLASVAPLGAWAALWSAVGLVLLAGSAMRRDELAFAAAVALKFLWALTYLLGWALHGVQRGWVSAAVWALFGTWVLIISTWPEKQWPVP